jgi:ABC-type oligopeptide transport system ATPase subunit
MLFIAHDPATVADISHQIALMYLRKPYNGWQSRRLAGAISLVLPAS